MCDEKGQKNVCLCRNPFLPLRCQCCVSDSPLNLFEVSAKNSGCNNTSKVHIDFSISFHPRFFEKAYSKC